MREDIVGMLKNAIDHGGNPIRVAQSLINSGYPMKDVREAFDYVVSLNPQLAQQQSQTPAQPQTQAQVSKQTPPSSQTVQTQQSPQKTPGSIQAMPPIPAYKTPIALVTSQQLQPLKPLPSQKTNPTGTGKIAMLVVILILLVVSLVTVIVLKDTILDILKL